MPVHVSRETETRLNPTSHPDDARYSPLTMADETISQIQVSASSLVYPPRRSVPARGFFSLPNHLFGRLILFVVVLALECLLRASLPHTETFLAPLASFGIAAFAVFLGLGYSLLRVQRNPLPFHTGLFLGHLAALAVLCLESAAAASGYEPVSLSPVLFFTLRIALLGTAVVQLALACIPLQQWIALRRITGNLWLYAILAGALTWLLRAPFQSLWNSRDFALSRSLQTATFTSVSALLRPLIPALQSDAPGFVLSAPKFAIYIAPVCSGLEGLGLILVFTLTWLTWFRREFRFPHALLLIPAALACVWLLNILRIAALMLIGNSISPEIALAGFHSQAGWIAFTLVALAFTTASRHLRWTQSHPASSLPHALAGSTEAHGESPATPAYLVPFLAILAASFVSKAASGVFEWLYPLRLIAALVALWHYRRSYRVISLRFTWLAPVAGFAIALLWILPNLIHPPASDPVAGGLAQLSPTARFFWIATRILASVITVPIAEELAFRGFLARRVAAHEFDTLPYAQLTFLPIIISSVLFGLMQGAWWPAGILSGLVFALVARLRNRLSDAIAAHAIANLFIAIWALSSHNFGLW